MNEIRFILSFLLMCPCLSLDASLKKIDFPLTTPQLTSYLKATIGPGIGYSSGYATAGLVIEPMHSDKIKAFLDFRGHYLLKGHWASNIGLVIRKIDPFQNKRIAGCNFYYDYRHGYKSYQQIGIGFESLGTDYAIRFNGYMPIGKRKCSFVLSEYYFSGGYYARCHKQNTALAGADLEIEAFLNKWLNLYFFEPHVAIKAYAYKGIIGGQVRMGFTWLNYLNLEIGGSYDHHYKLRIQGMVSIIMTTDAKKKSCWRLYQPVNRQEIIVRRSRQCVWEKNY